MTTDLAPATDVDTAAPFEPSLGADRVASARRWFESNSRSLRDADDRRYLHLGLDLVVPGGVFPLSSTSHQVGIAVLNEVQPGDRVLDMGTGCGVNAVLAATVSHDVVGVDINAAAIEAAAANAARNGVADRVELRCSDLFDAVPGAFDVIVFVPPFLWFTPRDEADRAITDEGYGTLTRFLDQAGAHLRPDGRILLLFASTGDMAYLQQLIRATGFGSDVVSTAAMEHEGDTATESVLRLTRVR